MSDHFGGLEPRKKPDVSESNAERVVIPSEVLDLVRFMCATWSDIDTWAHQNMDGESLMSYPQIQGTRNTFNLNHIGEQKHDTKKVGEAVKWMLEQSV